MNYLTRQEELILLAVYQLKESAYLVTIREHLKKHTKKNWSVGAVYVPLDRMRKRDLLETRIGGSTAKRGRNAIKYYNVTQLGLQALSAIKQVNDQMWSGFTPISE
ncbi:helix-turn-helix transcriptional regulator [Acidobacteriota bacterium]